LEDQEKHIADSDYYKTIKSITGEISAINRELHEELTLIILKRVVPGKCRYCPI
jgi:hypothetical protein